MPLTSDRAITTTDALELYLPVAASTTLHAGGLVMFNTAGFLVPGKVAADHVTAGYAVDACVNAGAAGDVSVRVRRRVAVWLKNSSADPVTAAERGKTCFVVDDETVAKTHATNTRSAAGKVLNISATKGVLVELA